MSVISTRYGRDNRKPVNEYTERIYVSGSGYKAVIHMIDNIMDP